MLTLISDGDVDDAVVAVDTDVDVDIWHSGLNTSPSKSTTDYELHVTGDVSWMMRQYLQLTNDTRFLQHDGGYAVIADMADFWVSRSVFSQTKGMFEIKGKIGIRGNS